MSLKNKIINNDTKGSIEVICGSMFSGKTEELLRRVKRAKIAKMKIAIFKPKIDSRYDDKKIVSHNKNSISAIAVKSAEDILKLVYQADIIAIDEAQFFNQELISIANTLANKGKRVIISGLDMDFSGEPFGIMPKLLSIAEHITKVHAICIDCGDPANYSFRKNKNTKLVQIGEKNEYSALCRNCFKQKK